MDATLATQLKEDIFSQRSQPANDQTDLCVSEKLILNFKVSAPLFFSSSSSP